ncbi:MAG: Bro-N domain-containing protein [Verrucomicrobiota bacterium]
MKHPADPTTAQRLLALVFEGHEIRTVFQDGKPLFVAKDVALAVEISKDRDVIRTHVDDDHVMSISLDVTSAKTKARKTQTFTMLTQGGVFALVMGSRKPAARKFQRWLADDVLPQLLKYGTYAPGATAGERCAALRGRWLAERDAEKTGHAAAYAESGLLTIAAFRVAAAIPARHALDFSFALRSLARIQGYEPPRFFTGPRRHTPAWPPAMLRQAALAVKCSFSPPVNP